MADIKEWLAIILAAVRAHAKARYLSIALP